MLRVEGTAQLLRSAFVTKMVLVANVLTNADLPPKIEESEREKASRPLIPFTNGGYEIIFDFFLDIISDFIFNEISIPLLGATSELRKFLQRTWANSGAWETAIMNTGVILIHDNDHKGSTVNIWMHYGNVPFFLYGNRIQSD